MDALERFWQRMQADPGVQAALQAEEIKRPLAEWVVVANAKSTN